MNEFKARQVFFI